MQATDAAERSAHVEREGNRAARYDYVWPALTVDDHLASTLAMHERRRALYARAGREMIDLPAEVLALEVVRLRRLLKQGGFW